MIDSVLKGTGNSRFLKSAVPAGTSWADALAMLQAGTFPIDFNGINAEGFQQVGTPLNKANLLKDATAAQIGLPPSTTPDGMFQALGNTGELHVWRKTVVTSNDVPAGYTLGAGEQTTLIIKSQSGSGTQYANVEYGNTCAVYDNGEPYIPNSTTTSNFIVTNSNTLATLNNTLKGKFCKFHAVSGSNRLTVSDGVFFIPSNATFQNEIPTSGDTKIIVDVAQKVNAYPLTPAGTTTTYPVSTNPNAYQEGDDAKAAGYTLGEVVTGTFQFAPNYNTTNAITYQSCSNLQISNDGAVGIDTSDPSYRQVTFKHNTNVDGSDFSNRFVRLSSYAGGSVSPNPQTPFNGAVPSQIVYIPSDTTFDFGSPSTFDRYQPVTGYPAIPAGTTIEYLGKLGDKARVQVVSYVGTGTYGVDNPNSLTFDFVPKCVFLQCVDYGPYRTFLIRGAMYANFKLSEDTYSQNHISWHSKTVSWFSTSYVEYQYNEAGKKYIALAIG